jgi:hypothetical protein
MGADNFFSLTTLPVLDPPPAEPPLALADLMARVPAGRAAELVRCVLLADDLRQREAVLAGERSEPDPAVLTVEQVAGDAPLPEAVAPGQEGPSTRTPADAIWSAYYRWADRRARELHSRFLRQWVGWEVTTRNALAVARARALELDPDEYVVARSLDHDTREAEALAAGWAAAGHPLDAFRGLLAARWRWIDRKEPWFTFDDDEFAAYAAKLVLLHRWLRASELGPRRHAEGTGEAA